MKVYTEHVPLCTFTSHYVKGETRTHVVYGVWPYGVICDLWTTNGSFWYVAEQVCAGIAQGYFKLEEDWVSLGSDKEALRQALRSAYDKSFPEESP